MRVKVYSNWWETGKGCVSLAVFCTEVTFSILSQVKLIFIPIGILMPKAYVQWKQDQEIFNKALF